MFENISQICSQHGAFRPLRPHRGTTSVGRKALQLTQSFAKRSALRRHTRTRTASDPRRRHLHSSYHYKVTIKVGCHWWGVYTPFDVDPKWPKLRAIDEPSSSGTDSRKRTKNVMSFKNSDTQWLAVAPVCQMEMQIGNSCIVECMRATLDYMRTVEEFPTYARHTTMHTT